MKDWMHVTHAEMNEKVGLVVTYFGSEQNRMRLGLQYEEEHPSAGERDIIPTKLTVLGTWYYNTFLPKATAYKAAFAAWVEYSKRTPADQVKLNDTETAIKKEMRHLHNSLKSTPGITNNDLLAMGFPIHQDTTNTPTPVPASYPAATLLSERPGVVTISYRDSETEHKGKPHGVHGALMVYGILVEEPLHWEELTERIFSTTSPITLHFDLSMRGRKIYVAMCWENTTGQHGDYGPIVSGIIG
ncbi:MAG: hypothetical protein LBD21_03035 [Tannerellaceae bacterium]|jgi:hypothetical protein|nr:hypothetical protein [Tannerellaceae bacterium]